MDSVACANPECATPEKYTTNSAERYTCAGCRSAWYCSVPCQRANWKAHKPACRAAAEALKTSQLFAVPRRAAPARPPPAGGGALWATNTPTPAQVLEIMLSRVRDVAVARAGCAFLTILPASLHQAVVACGGARAIVAALHAHPADAFVTNVGCEALCKFAARSEARKQAVVDGGGIPAIVAALRAHCKVAAVVEAGCQALRNIASGPDVFSEAIVDGGGVPAIVAALHAHPEDASVTAHGCGALSNIAFGSAALVQAVVDGGGVPAIVAALHAHPEDASVTTQGCGALCNIAAESKALKQAVVDAGGQQYLDDAPAPAQP